MTANPLKALPAEQFDYWKAQHLLNRAGFGAPPVQTRAFANMGLRDAVDALVDYRQIEIPAIVRDEFDPNIMRRPTPEERQAQRRARQNGDEAAIEQFRLERQRRQREDRRQMSDMKVWWLQRMIETPRPLEEKLTLFWHGHFATSYRTIEDSYHMFLQNQTLRAGATGRFSTLVKSIIRDPAMLRYLDNNRNVRGAPNENLARELMELFTLGEGNTYTENDIKEGARALTGYTFNDDSFQFVANWHDDGIKTILGNRWNWDGDEFVRIILTKKVASEYITLKLYRYFVNDVPGEPDEETKKYVIALARRFREKDYDIADLLRTMFSSAHFYADRNVASQIKSPIQLVVQAIRSLRTPTRRLRTLLRATDLMGQNIFFPPSVKGWDGGRAWINTSTMFVRQNTMIYLLTGREAQSYDWERDAGSFDALHLVEHLRTNRGRIPVREACTYLLRFNLGTEPRPERVDALVRFVDDHGGRLSNPMLIGLLSLITAMPEYQLC